MSDPAQWLILAAAALILGCAVAWNIYDEHSTIDTVERERMASQVKLIGDNLNYQLIATNLALEAIRSELVLPHQQDDGQQQLDRRLRALGDALPALRALFIVDAAGRVSASSVKEIVGRRLTPQEYLSPIDVGADPAVLHVMPALPGARGATINLVKRVPAAKGLYAGSIVATLEPSFLNIMLDSAEYAPDMWCYLAQAGGKPLLTRSAQYHSEAAAPELPASVYAQHRASGQMVTVMTGELDTRGEERLVAQRTIMPAGLDLDQALQLALTRDLASIFASWRWAAYSQAAAYSLLVMVSGLGLLGYQRRQAKIASASRRHMEEQRRSDEEHQRNIQGSLEFTRNLLASMQDGLSVVDANGVRTDVNPALCALTGFSREELLGSDPPHPHWPPEEYEHIQAALQKARRGGAQDFELTFMRKNGERFPAIVSASSVKDGRGAIVGYLATIKDISARKRAEQDLAAAKADAERADQAKSRFLAAASHDLRQPLAALSLYVGVLKNRTTADNGSLVASIQDCVDSLSELLTDLLDVSKLEAGVVKSKPTDFPIDAMFDTLITLHGAEAALKGLRLRVRHSRAIVRTDRRLLQRVLGNLLANAIRYTATGGVLLACRRRQGKRWAEVWDTGVGIAAEQTALVFEEFRQLGDDAHSRGSGLGLAIVAKTAALLGLEIRLLSRPGRGSMFAIELPPGQLEAEAPPLAEQAAATGSRTLRIALVEDNAMVIQALILALEGAGHEVIEATSGAALFQRLGKDVPDILIADYRLADTETGFDVIEAARRIYGRSLPTVLITGDTDPALVRSMADRGTAVYYKPLQIEALLAFIRHATEQRS